jgi:hypothetical protein
MMPSPTAPAGAAGAYTCPMHPEVVSAGPAGLRILAQGGFVEVSRVRLDDGPKIASTEAGIPEGAVLSG